jgi:phospholipid/cholesterol/gamma-HCH transport system substrate-binding protein
MKKPLKQELIIGLCVILALLILFFGIDYLKGINVFKAANYYYVSYTNVEGLSVSSPVTANGFKVGLVRDMAYEYDNPGHVKVEISLDKELKVPQGTKAKLVVDILGTATIALEMPQPASSYCKVGDSLDGYIATGMMDNVTNDLLPSVASIMPKIDTLITSINTLVADPALAASIHRLDNITANLEATTAQLAKSTSTLPTVMTSAKSAVGNVDAISSDLKVLSAELRDMPLDSTMQNVYASTIALRQMLASLQSKDSSLGMLMNDPALYNNLNNAVGSLDSLLIDVKKNPKRYISIKLL